MTSLNVRFRERSGQEQRAHGLGVWRDPPAGSAGGGPIPDDLPGVSAAPKTRVVQRRPGARSHAEGICRPRLTTDARSRVGSPATVVSAVTDLRARRHLRSHRLGQQRQPGNHGAAVDAERNVI